MALSEGLSEEKTKGSKVWSLLPQETGTVDGDKNCDRTTFSGGWSSESRTAEQLRVGVGVREQSKKSPSGLHNLRLEPTRRQLDAEKKKQTERPRVESLNKSAGVRRASVHALKNLYEVDDNAPNLGRFTRRFSSQKIGLAGDFDISIAISAIDLVKQLLRHQLLPPEIRHAQVSNSSQSGAKGFSCHDHGTINIAYRWENFICVGVDSKLTDVLTGHVTDLTCNKFYRLSRNIYITMAGFRSRNIYITMAGFRMAWEEMWQWITSVCLWHSSQPCFGMGHYKSTSANVSSDPRYITYEG